MSDNNTNTTVNVTIAVPRKSMAIAVMLTVLFGPIGLMYASLSGGLIMLAVNVIIIVASFFTFGLAGIFFLFTWAGSILWAVLAVNGSDPSDVVRVSRP